MATKIRPSTPGPEGDGPPSPTHPAPAHLRESHEDVRRSSSSAGATAASTGSSTDDDDEREATELRPVGPERRARPSFSRVLSPGQPPRYWYDPVRRYWRHEIRISVPHVDCRDHLANERTFLGYLRTSVILSMIGIFIAQFYRLQHAPNPSRTFGYWAMSKPLALVFQGAALVVVALGGWRFWRQQSAMARGRVYAGGFEVVVIGVGTLLLLVMVFGVHIALAIVREDRPWPVV